MVSLVDPLKWLFGLNFAPNLHCWTLTRLRRVQTVENIAAVSASVNDDHQLAIRRCSQRNCASVHQQRVKFCERI